MSVIEVNHITKEYRLGYLTSFKDNLRGMLARLRGQHPPERKLFKALDDIDFNVMQGEVVGIIGSNGAGKSTLLKILANIVQPTSGKIHIEGKIAPLIEVGAGLVGDLTGRENIFLNSSILGIPRPVIKKKMDEIISFAELEEFIDTPIKRYSSGMKVRLGFSIATSIDSDILIVDEVLAVGDLVFQRKCFDRMEELIKGRGNTVLLVSHNIRQIERMCSRVILLDQGKILADAGPNEVCTQFYQQSNVKVHLDAAQGESTRKREDSSGEVDVEKIEIINDKDEVVDEIISGESLCISAQLRFNCDVKKPEIVIGTHTTDFVYLTANSTAALEDRPDFDKGNHIVICRIPTLPFAPGVYCIRITVFDQYRRTIYSGETLKTFSMRPTSNETKKPPWRLFDVDVHWVIQNKHYSSFNDGHKGTLLG